MAGVDWLRGFRKRNPSISLRIPEATSAARASAFNKPQVQKYFRCLTATIDEFKFEPQQIWNVDESGFTTVPSQHPKIFATKGRKQVGILTSAERGHHYTAVCCANALGSYIPPAFIFPRKNMKIDLMDNAPTGAVGFAQEKGWMSGEVFLKWMAHFVKFAKPTKENKALLLLDGHSSHKNFDVLTYAKENGIIVMCFPPHCTHRLQPLDVSFYGPLNIFYNQELNTWLKSHPGRTVTHQQVAGIFKEAYLRAATVKNIQSGFKSSGIFPLNENIFPDHMFAPAAVTDIEMQEPVIAAAAPETEETIAAPAAAVTGVVIQEPIVTAAAPETEVEEIITAPAVTESEAEEPIAPAAIDKTLTSREIHDRPEAFNEPAERSSIPKASTSNNTEQDLTIADISPLPVATITKRSNRKKGKFGILNSTPDMEELKSVVAMKRAEEHRKSARRTKKRVFYSSSDSDQDVSKEEDEDPFCIYCTEPYSRSRAREWWLRCQICKRWCHAQCIGLPKSSKVVICDVCK